MPHRDTILKVAGYGFMLAGMLVMLIGAWAMAEASGMRPLAPVAMSIPR